MHSRIYAMVRAKSKEEDIKTINKISGTVTDDYIFERTKGYMDYVAPSGSYNEDIDWFREYLDGRKLGTVEKIDLKTSKGKDCYIWTPNQDGIIDYFAKMQVEIFDLVKEGDVEEFINHKIWRIMNTVDDKWGYWIALNGQVDTFDKTLADEMIYAPGLEPKIIYDTFDYHF